jgi:hypothetical protein
MFTSIKKTVAIAVIFCVVSLFTTIGLVKAQVSTPVFLTRAVNTITTWPRSVAFNVGTTTPIAKLAVYLNVSDVTSGNSHALAFLVASSTPTGTSTPLAITKGAKVGIGTTTPASLFDIFSTGTTTVTIDNNTTKGGCLKVKNNLGTGYVYFVADAAYGGWATTTSANCQ